MYRGGVPWPEKEKVLSVEDTGQTTVNKGAPIHNIIPIKWHGPQTPLKMFQKIQKKFHDEAVQSNILWLNWNKIGDIGILQSAHKQGNPSFHFHAPGSKRRYPCTHTASAVPKYFPCLLQFCTGYRIWHASRISTSCQPDRITSGWSNTVISQYIL